MTTNTTFTDPVTLDDGVSTATLTRSILTTLAALAAGAWDVSAALTGAAYVALGGNLASALDFKQGATSYLKLVTTTNAARVKLGVLRADADAVTVTIAANHTLVLGTAGANQTRLTGQVLFLNNTSGSSKDLTFPAWSTIANIPIHAVNIGSDSVVLKDSGGNGIGTIASGKGGVVLNNGTAGGALLSA